MAVEHKDLAKSVFQQRLERAHQPASVKLWVRRDGPGKVEMVIRIPSTAWAGVDRLMVSSTDGKSRNHEGVGQ